MAAGTGLGTLAHFQCELVPHASEQVGKGLVRVAGADEEQVRAARVLGPLLLVERGLERPHRFQQALLVNERQEGDPHPGHLLPIHVHLEVLGVEVNDGRVGFHHEILIHRRERVPAQRRQAGHELLEGLEGLRVRWELDDELAEPHKVRGEGGVMERIKPASQAPQSAIEKPSPISKSEAAPPIRQSK